MRILFLVILVTTVSACTSTVIDTTGPTGPEPEVVRFSADVLPVFAASCGGIGCHVGFRISGVALDSHDAVTASVGLQYGGPIVIPGNAADSPIMDKLSPNPRHGLRMPLGKAPLSAAEQEAIRTWIQDGALDN